jgi:hypothetical protein
VPELKDMAKNNTKSPLAAFIQVLPLALLAVFGTTTAEAGESATSVATGSFPRPAEVKALPDTKVVQTPSPDNGILSILFNDVKASAQSEQTASAGASILIRVPLAPRQKTHVVADLRGSSIVSGKAQCRVTLSGVGSTVIARVRDGALFARLTITVRAGASELILLASVLCERQPDGAALATLDSIDLAWDRKRG